MSVWNHRPPRQKSRLAGFRGDVELSQHQVKVLLQALKESSVDSIAGNLDAPPDIVQGVVESLLDPLYAMDFWFDEHELYLRREWPYDDEDLSEEGTRCRWCHSPVGQCDRQRMRCQGSKIRASGLRLCSNDEGE